jgi:hypothetical protein
VVSTLTLVRPLRPAHTTVPTEQPLTDKARTDNPGHNPTIRRGFPALQPVLTRLLGAGRSLGDLSEGNLRVTML